MYQGENDMKKSYLLFIFIFLVFFLFNCKESSTSPKQKSTKTELEGKWIGTEPGNDFTFTFTFSGESLTMNSTSGEYHNGTFTVNTSANPKQLNFAITSGSETNFVGKVALFIYSINNNVLTLSGAEPGVQTRPVTFSDTGTRTWVLNKQP